LDPFKPWQPKQRPPLPARLAAEDAQAVALQAVAFIAASDELLPRFVALSGCGLDDLRGRIADAAFLGGVLDFILADEPTLLAFASDAGFAPETPMAARRLLP
jgi:hypothetical protein